MIERDHRDIFCNGCHKGLWRDLKAENVCLNFQLNGEYITWKSVRLTTLKDDMNVPQINDCHLPPENSPLVYILQ